MIKVAAILTLVLTTSAAFADTMSFSKDFIVSTHQSVDYEPNKSFKVEPFETFSNTGYFHNGLNVYPTFKLISTFPSELPVTTYVDLQPQQLSIFWEGTCANGTKTFQGQMVSADYLRIRLGTSTRKISINGLATVVGECK